MYQKLLSYLAALGLFISSGQATAVPAYLEEIPDDLLSDLVDDLDADELQDADRVKLALVLAEDPRSQVRKLSAQLAQDVRDPAIRPQALELIQKLAKDHCSSVRADAVYALATQIETMGALEANSLICNWATADITTHRMAMASALSIIERQPAGSEMCMELALEHLATDRNWRVRAAAAKASVARKDDNPDFYALLLAQLQQDQARSVRRIVKKGLASD